MGHHPRCSACQQEVASEIARVRKVREFWPEPRDSFPLAIETEAVQREWGRFVVTYTDEMVKP
jgi:hypothetical protein